jgi:hypothetical protein
MLLGWAGVEITGITTVADLRGVLRYRSSDHQRAPTDARRVVVMGGWVQPPVASAVALGWSGATVEDMRLQPVRKEDALVAPPES